MQFKFISPLEKCFLDETIRQYSEYKQGSAFKNERFHFSAIYSIEATSMADRVLGLFSLESPIKDCIHVWKVEHIPSKMPCRYQLTDDDYLRTTPGLYPDMLAPLDSDHRLRVTHNLESLFFEVELNGDISAGNYPITVKFFSEENPEICLCNQTFMLTVIDALLPAQETIYTNWVHYDCLAVQYHVEVFSPRHWEIMENFLKAARRAGINMILTPVLTPPLDTYVGGERPTVQLVDIEVKDGQYSFDFTNLGKFVDLCDRLGFQYFEISHFFTQWGAYHAPKVMATVDGEYRRIFGWDTDSTGPEYTAFLRQLIPALLTYMKKHSSADKRCWFHISDEPKMDYLEQYKKARHIVDDLLADYPIIDAISHYDFYKEGVIKQPIPSTNAAEEFINEKVDHLWVYYCCVGWDVSNRFFSMPLSRTRVIGTQFYKYAIEGFLHWGFNFYFNQYSHASINPFLCSDGDYFGASGDMYVVYPAGDGTAYESLRGMAFYDALQDVRAFKLCESLYGREYVMHILEDGEQPITFTSYPKNRDYLIKVRCKINAAIAEKYGNKDGKYL